MDEAICSVLGIEGAYPLVLILLGNPLRGDDGFGPFLAERLMGKLDSRCAVVPAFDRPEEAWEVAVALRPGRVVLVDSADFGGHPGELRLLRAQGREVPPLSTHRFPVEAVARLIEVDTGAPVHLLLVQAGECRLGSPLSGTLREVAERLAAFLEETYARKPSGG